MEVIKSINFKQEDLIADIIKLHVPSGQIECDVTFSKGQFYKNKVVKEPLLKFDKHPINNSIQNLDVFFALPNEQFNSLISDLPFVISKGKSLETKKKGTNIISSRFSSFENPKLLFDCYAEILQQCYNKLKPDGILIWKCQPTVSGGKNYFIDFYSIKKATEIGFYCKDKGVLLAKNRLNSGKIKQQQHLRRFESYFIVFQKKTKTIINYNV